MIRKHLASQEGILTMEETSNVLSEYAKYYNLNEYLALNEEMTFSEYLQKVKQNPKLARNASQYVFDMIVSKGTSKFERYRKTHTKYHFFDDPEIPIFGLEETLSNLVDFIHGAAGGYGTERRILLMHGPVGSSKSTIARLIKKGLERYSVTPEGAWYTFKWINLPIVDDAQGPAIYTSEECLSAMHENPIKLMPVSMRNEFLKDINRIHLEQWSDSEEFMPYSLISEGELNPRCRLFMNMLLSRYQGDWQKVINNHIVVVRKAHSEIDRVGIATFQPKDEKNQDSTELTGDMNFQKISHFGTDSDARAFNFDGEFEVANRGVVEMIEMLKLDNAFLYDLLGAAQEHAIKPKKFPQVVVDELILAHTNNPEFEKLKNNESMEALRDRTVKVDVPYLIRWSDEIKVYMQNYGPTKVKQHIMPHTLEIAALFAVLTRLNREEDSLPLRDKAKLYDGHEIPGWTEDSVKELQDKNPDEGMKGGLSARYIQDGLSNCLSRNRSYINVFHVISELKSRLVNCSLITNIEDIKHYEYCAELATKELDEILKTEVQRALVSDEKAIERLCSKYLDNLIAYVNDEKIIHPITKEKINPDEKLMRSIEEKNNIPEQLSDDFRRSIATFIGTFAQRGKQFRWDSNSELRRALEAKIFEDVKDTVKLASLTQESAALDPDLQEKIDAIKTRLIKQYGYNEQSARDVLEYVSSLYSRGDVQ